MNDGPSVFARLIEEPEKERPKEPDVVRLGPQPIIPPVHRKSSPSEKLLEWLVNHWPKPVITLRDISAYGPNCARDPTNRASLIETLTEYGWLVPVEAWRRDQKKWRVVRGPSKDIQNRATVQG
jgi:hypothetical protein